MGEQHCLVCRSFSGHMGLYFHDFSVIRYTNAAHGTKERRDSFLTVSTEIDDPSAYGDSFQGKLHINEVRRFEVVPEEPLPQGSTGAPSIEIDIDSWIKCVGSALPCTHRPIDSLQIQLRFKLEGDKFTISPESRPALERLNERAADR